MLFMVSPSFLQPKTLVWQPQPLILIPSPHPHHFAHCKLAPLPFVTKLSRLYSWNSYALNATLSKRERASTAEGRKLVSGRNPPYCAVQSFALGENTTPRISLFGAFLRYSPHADLNKSACSPTRSPRRLKALSATTAALPGKLCTYSECTRRH
jgi:hypothetical protein